MDAQLSDDQDFGANKVFLTDQGEWVISFDTTRLTDVEVKSIHANNAKWRSKYEQ